MRQNHVAPNFSNPLKVYQWTPVIASLMTVFLPLLNLCKIHAKHKLSYIPSVINCEMQDNMKLTQSARYSLRHSIPFTSRNK
jgi:hypothetical protein